MWMLVKYPFINVLYVSGLATLQHLLTLRLLNFIDLFVI